MRAGVLPASWGSPQAFKSLTSLELLDLPLRGKLPSKWSNSGAFPALRSMGLGATNQGGNSLSGSLPPEWGTFQQLQRLQIGSCSITGDCVTIMGPVCGCVQSVWGVTFLACQ